MMSKRTREPTRILAEFAAALSYDDLPQRSREHCKNLMDALACAHSWVTRGKRPIKSGLWHRRLRRERSRA